MLLSVTDDPLLLLPDSLPSPNVLAPSFQAVEDQQSSGGFSGSSLPDLESDVGVRRAKVLTASLKSVGGRAQSWIAALKQQGAGAAACAQVALEAAKDEFGDVRFHPTIHRLISH